MTKDEAKEFLREFLKDRPNFRKEHPGQDEEVYRQMDRLAEALDMAIEALGKDLDDPTTDLISRQVAIFALKKQRGVRPTWDLSGLSLAINVLNELPPAQVKVEACDRPCTEDDYWYCNDCDHTEVCRYYPMKGCEYKSQPSAQPVTITPESSAVKLQDCNDTISRAAVLEMVNAWTYNLCDPEDDWAALKAIRDIPSAQPAPQWIPCSERLPKVGEDVLFSVAGVYAAEGCLRADGNWAQFRWDGIQHKNMVDAWMPLPEPYEGKT